MPHLTAEVPQILEALYVLVCPTVSWYVPSSPASPGMSHQVQQVLVCPTKSHKTWYVQGCKWSLVPVSGKTPVDQFALGIDKLIKTLKIICQ